MGLSTLGVGAAVSPALIKAWLSHFTSRKEKHGKPTAHISYDVGLALVRQFLLTASHDTVEELQHFTAQLIPAPSWVRTEKVDIPERVIFSAVDKLQEHLGPQGIERIGGELWWQWRRHGEQLRAEWIEMKKDYDLRKKQGTPCRRAMLYVHGGAYFFGSVDMHRYQIQRHARKLQARAIAPRYRLAPQYPFPCGLLDCLATYMFLLEHQPPETIILAGDSAGGGMVLSMLVICRDQGIPLPAGAVLISPWVDLTHSFPSVAQDSGLDYIPPAGFHHKPSDAWPPPNIDELRALDELMVPGPDGEKIKRKDYMAELVATARKGKGKSTGARQISTSAADVRPMSEPKDPEQEHEDAIPGVGDELSVVIDGSIVELKDQIQMYAPNELLSHPLVSPVLQPSLGGLPPLLVLVGGGEMLRDEQIYLAHKAANPASYVPPESPLQSRESIDAALRRYPPTSVQLQVWDDMCHVAPTLSFTRPAKFMYRSVAQFGAWALARAQLSEIRILADDDISDIESDDDSSEDGDDRAEKKMLEKQERTAHYANPNQTPSNVSLTRVIGKAGDPLPPFHKNMIRQRVTRHGQIFPLQPAAKLPGCTMPRSEIGTIKPGPVAKWLDAQQWFDNKFAKEKRKVQTKRAKEIEAGGVAVFLEEAADLMSNALEKPPPTALAGRRKKDLPPKSADRRSGKGVAMWAKYGSNHDEIAIEKEEEKIARKQNVTMSVTAVRAKGAAVTPSAAAAAGPSSTPPASGAPQLPMVTVAQQLEMPALEARAAESSGVATEDHAETNSPRSPRSPSATFAGAVASMGRNMNTNNASAAPDSKTGHLPLAEDGATSPFKVANPAATINPSTMTLASEAGVIPTDQTNLGPPTLPDDDEEPVIATAEAKRVPGPASSSTAVAANSINAKHTSWGQGVLSVLPTLGFSSKGKEGAEEEGEEEDQKMNAAVDQAAGAAPSGGPLSGNVDNHQHNQFGGNVRDGVIGHDALAGEGPGGGATTAPDREETEQSLKRSVGDAFAPKAPYHATAEDGRS